MTCVPESDMADEPVLVSVVQVVEFLKDNLQLLSRSHGEPILAYVVVVCVQTQFVTFFGGSVLRILVSTYVRGL